MTHVVSALRASARAALQTALPGVTWRQDWWTKVTPRLLPMGGVGTPRVLVARDSVDDVLRTVDLVVVVKRTGGVDVEDTLWADAATAEVALLGLLADLSTDYDLAETQVTVDAAGEAPVGELSMLFRCVLRTREGTPETLI